MKKQKNKENKRLISTFEIFVMITAVFAFAYLISDIGLVKAETTPAQTAPPIPTGCCVEAKDGSICQDMNKLDSAMCKTSLLPTKCETIDSCKKGCCYDSNSGICSLNSPKDKCANNGGNWSDGATCDISQCQLGCCILGNQAPLITSRECSKLSNQYSFKKNFQAVGSDGGCNSYANLYEEGACVLSEGDCSFTTKQSCQGKSGTFYKDFLCTNPDLKTICVPKVKDEFRTSCIDGKDQVYFIDSCGNTANIYDSSRANDPEYWKKVVPKEQSCASTPNSASCGNCDYMTGSVCMEYRPGKDANPDMGNNICRNLNCLNGKKHGESWCISDYDTSQFGSAPVGSRFFKGICMDGEVSIEPCADFNQEICIQGTYAGGSFTEATCRTNNWRSCISANSDNATYDEIKEECDKLPDDCVMFLDIPGNDKYENYPGFIKGDELVDSENYGGGKSNTPNGASDDIGKDANTIIPRCVPKYNPGMVFWQASNDTTKKGNTGQQGSMGYGGSLDETKAICALGSFTCVGKQHTSSAFSGWDWWDNQVCSDDETKTPIMMEALNERCKSLGPCGLQVNVAGELGSNTKTENFTKMVKIDRDGGQGDWKSDYQIILDSYLEELKSKPGVITPGTMKSLDTAPSGGDSSEVAGSGSGTGSVPTAPNDLSSTIQEAKDNSGDTADAGLLMGLGGGALSVAAMTAGGGSVLSLGGSVLGAGGGIALGAAAWAAVGAVAGYIIGQLAGRWGHMSVSETNALAYSMAAGAGTGVGTALGLILGGATFCDGGYIICVAIGLLVWAIVQTITYLVAYDAESQYFVTSYTCEPWEPPHNGNCDSCNSDIRTCSEYRCRSLGTNCQYYNTNGEPGWCASLTDTFSATIIPWPDALTTGYSYINTQELKTTIVKGTSDELDPYSTITFGVETNKPAICKIDTKHTGTFDDMTYDMLPQSDETGKTGSKHKVALSYFVTSTSSTTTDSETTGTGTTAAAITGAATSTTDTTTDTTTQSNPNTTTATTAENSIATLPMKIGTNTYYIRCRNYAGQFNAAEFVVRLNVGEGPDLTAPIITRFIPETDSYVGYGFNTTTIQFYTSEPAECRYSKDYNFNYDNMTGKTTCTNMAVVGEWPCYAILNLTGEENNYYFKCKDTAGNKNENAYNYNLKSCQSGLNITSKSPFGSIKIGTQTSSIELYLKTSGCIEGGRSTCSYNLGNGPIEFLESNSTEHLQVFTTLPAGNYNIPVSCTDIAGNTANDVISFNLTIVNTAPIVIFASKLGGILKIVTNEPAQCRYAGNNTNSCSFNFEEGIPMTGSQTIHTITYESEKTYYVKCRNTFNITNSDCGIVVMPGE